MEKLDRLYPKLRIGRKCANPKCQNPAVHMHHIVRRNVDLLRFDVKNLLPLCAICHAEIHDKGLYDRGMEFVSEDVKNYLLEMKNKDFKQYLLDVGLSKEEFFAIKEREILDHIGKTEFIQNTPEWLERKQSGIGASEIAAIVKSFLTVEELKSVMGEKPALNFLGEDLYSTGYQVYHKIKFGYQAEPLPDELAVYGHAMEQYLDYKVKDNEDFDFRPTSDFIVRSDISPYAVCSPDGYAFSKKDGFTDVSNKYHTVKNLVWEKKTVHPFKAMKENIFYNGLPWQYIFQLQYQMMLKECEAGILSSMTLEEDTPFNRGRIVAMVYGGEVAEIDNLFNIRTEHFIYGVIPEIQNAILQALKNFDKAIKEGNPPAVNKDCARLSLKDFKIFQAIYKSNPEATKFATHQDDFNGTSLYEFINDYIGLNEVIKHNKNQDDINKVLLKKYMYDNNLCEIHTLDGGSVRLSPSGSLLTKAVS